MSTFCPICASHHDPSIGCADRVGEALREAGIERQPMGKVELETTVKKANRVVVVSVIVVLSLLFLTILLALLMSNHK